MTNQDKRALEIIITLIIQHMRKNNSQALNHLKAFFYSMAYENDYDPLFLYAVCTKNLEILEKIPSHYEIVMLTQIKSDLLHINRKKFKKLYPKTINADQIRTAKFLGEKINLNPKIKNKYFHEELLTFLKKFATIGSTIPIK